MPGEPVGLEHAADAEGGRAREQQDGRGCDQGTRAPVRWRPRRRWPGLSGRRSRGAVERRVLGKDRLLQPPQLAARLDADLLDQHCARLAVGLEGLRLAPAAVQREHAPGVQLLAQRVLVDQRVELADHLAVPAGARSASIASSARAQPQLLESPDLGARERLVGHVGQCLAAPQRERLPGARRRRAGARSRTASTSPSDQPQLIAAPAGDDLRAVAVEQRGAGATRRAAPSSARWQAGRSPQRPSARRSAETVRPGAARASPAPRAAWGHRARSSRPSTARLDWP